MDCQMLLYCITPERLPPRALDAAGTSLSANLRMALPRAQAMLRDMSPDEKLLAMTSAVRGDRLKRSRQALASWRWEAKLPLADREMIRTIAETELGALRYFVPLLPDALQPDLAALLHDWDEFRSALSTDAPHGRT
jgi:hypothetical protein